jgi:hypothetical protein
MDLCLFFFVCTSYKSTFLNRSDNTWRHLRLHIMSPCPPFQWHISLAEWLHRLASPHSHVRICVTNTSVYMGPSSGRFSTCFILSARSRACVHCRVVTYSRHLLLCYSHGTFFCNLLNTLLRLRPLTCVCVFVSLSTPAWLHLPDISIFAIAAHSFSHICTLSNTHFCSCLHCHYYEVPFPYIRQ